jgi:hypothetical protein
MEPQDREKYPPITATLGNATTATLRPLSSDDAAKPAEFYRRVRLFDLGASGR